MKPKEEMTEPEGTNSLTARVAPNAVQQLEMLSADYRARSEEHQRIRIELREQGRLTIVHTTLWTAYGEFADKIDDLLHAVASEASGRRNTQTMAGEALPSVSGSAARISD